MPPAALYQVALHHIAAFLFRTDAKADVWLRKELCRAAVRGWSGKPHAFMAMLEADAAAGRPRAERIKFVEESAADDADAKAAFAAVMAARP